MEIQPDLLAQLRDIQPPATPGWWPPALGWWLLAAAVLILLAWSGLRLWRRWRRFRPARTARSLHHELAGRLAAQTISAEAWLHEANQLLKRLAVHGLGHRQMSPAWDAEWLRYLDGRYGTQAFSRGVGRCLGAARFRPGAEVDVPAVQALLSRYLNRECRRFWRLRDDGLPPHRQSLEERCPNRPKEGAPQRRNDGRLASRGEGQGRRRHD